MAKDDSMEYESTLCIMRGFADKSQPLLCAEDFRRTVRKKEQELTTNARNYYIAVNSKETH